uniref:Uncharacterized protein n=1 Tax=Globodera rostochiensis TaxID=31243 RepID=A0A914HXS8_GLORO
MDGGRSFFLHWKCAVPMRKCGVMPNRIKSSANLFSLDTVSAEVRLAKALDRETQQRHVLKMRECWPYWAFGRSPAILRSG